MADEATGEVRIKLVVDDLSKSIVEGVKQGFAEMNAEAEKTKKAAGSEGIAGEVFKGNLAFGLASKSASLLAEGVHQAWEFTEKLADAAMEAADQQAMQERGMAGLLLLMDGGAHSMEQLKAYTGDVIDEFENLAIKSGTAASSMVDAYDQLISRGTMSSEKAKDLTEQMATVGKIVPGGIGALSSGMAMMEAGMVRARNPIVQLIAATHTLQGNAKAVAAQLQHMTPEKQIEMGERAIAKQAEALKKAGAIGAPSLGELKVSFDELKDKFLEGMGKPILAALVPHLVAVRDFLAEHVEAIEEFGAKVGYEVGHAVDFLSDIVSGVYDAFHENWDEVASTFDELTESFRGMWDFGKANAGTIAHTFKDITVDFIHAMKWVADTMDKVRDGIVSVLKMVPGIGDKIREAHAGNEEARARTAARGVTAEGDAQFNAQVETYRKAATEAGTLQEEINRNIASMRDWHNEFLAQSDAVAHAVASKDSAGVAEYFQKAIDTNNQGSLDYAFSLLNDNEALRDAFVTGKVSIHGGFQELIHVLGEKAPELAAKMREAANIVKKEGGIKAPGHQVNFYGAAFHITQDLRGEDPDRVILTFRKDISRAATARIQA